jgi:hypothetical protein
MFVKLLVGIGARAASQVLARVLTMCCVQTALAQAAVQRAKQTHVRAVRTKRHVQ